jgi:alpha-tubulin suppressor-like RCC1 family protein
VYAWGWKPWQVRSWRHRGSAHPDEGAGAWEGQGHRCRGVHSLALTESGEVYAWGSNERGQLGLGDTENRLTPTKVPGLRRVKASQRVIHSLALTESGEVYTCGWNKHGQLGLGDTENRLTPTKVPGLSAVKAISSRCAIPLP